jgi:thiol-disulfide isomerase/thioredoxin
MKTSNCFITGLLMFCFACSVKSQSTAGDAAKAWQDVQNAAAVPLPSPPAKWEKEPPTPEERQQYYASVSAAAKAVAKQAETFYTQFPDSTNVIAARKLECQMLSSAFYQVRSQSGYDAWMNAENGLLAVPGLTEDDRFDARLEIAQSKRSDPYARDYKARNTGYENALRQLIKDYPHKDKPLEQLIILGAESDDDKARAIATEVLAGPVSDSVKQRANAILNRLDAIGKPLNIKFTALDGRQVDLSQIKDKVVLVDFWATWCGPCVGEIPHVKETYDKLHSKGFEVVGISFDNDQNALQKFVKTHDLPWPQYFDGKVWENKFGLQYAIESIPTMWLVDKKGNLRDSNARDNLQGRVEKLLAE